MGHKQLNNTNMKKLILLRISEVNEDIRYFFRLGNIVRRDMNIKSIKIRNANTAEAIKNYYKTLSTIDRILDRLINKKGSLHSRLVNIS